MPDRFPTQRFGTPEELIAALKHKSDDMESVSVMVVNDLPIVGPQGHIALASNACGLIKTCNGTSIMVHRDDLAMLLNDGILQRLRIPISLIPLEDK